MPPSPSNTAVSSASPDSLSFVGTIALGVYHVVLAAFLMAVLYIIWPGMLTKGGQGLTQTVQLFGEMKFHIRPDVRWLLLVMVVSALGSFVHSAASFADYVGNQRINKSWVWYYLLRVPIGVAPGAGVLLCHPWRVDLSGCQFRCAQSLWNCRHLRFGRHVFKTGYGQT